MKPLDAEYFFNRKVIINKLESIINDNDQSETSFVSKKAPEEASVNIERHKGGENKNKIEEPVAAEEIFKNPVVILKILV